MKAPKGCVVKTAVVGFEGWFLFCPCWLPADQERMESLTPYPKYGLWWLLDAAIAVQQARNWCLSFFLPEEYLGFGFRYKPLPEPRVIEYVKEVEP